MVNGSVLSSSSSNFVLSCHCNRWIDGLLIGTRICDVFSIGLLLLLLLLSCTGIMYRLLCIFRSTPSIKITLLFVQHLMLLLPMLLLLRVALDPICICVIFNLIPLVLDSVRSIRTMLLLLLLLSCAVFLLRLDPRRSTMRS